MSIGISPGANVAAHPAAVARDQVLMDGYRIEPIGTHRPKNDKR